MPAVPQTPDPGKKVLPLKVFPENVSVPANVARVPVVGRVTLVEAVVVRVRGNAPEAVKASAKETVFPAAIVKVPVPVVMVFPLMEVNVAPAPVKVVVAAVPMVPVVVMALPVEIAPKPEAIEPEANAPTVVKDEVKTPEPKVVPESTLVPFMP